MEIVEIDMETRPGCGSASGSPSHWADAILQWLILPQRVFILQANATGYGL